MVHSDSPSRHPLIRWTAKAVLIAFISNTIPLQAWAATTPPCAITGFRSGKSAQEERVRKVLNDQLKSNKNIQLENDAEVATKLQEYNFSTIDPKSQATVAAAYDHFNTGMQFYRKLDLTNALKEFNASVRGYREGISILRDNHYLLFSHLYLGIILHFLGRVEEGKKFIQEMVMLDPQRKTRVLPQRDFPPKIVELHRQITREVLAKPISVLSVDSTPSGASVLFDGSEVGKTPFQIKDIPTGQHFLSLDLQGYQYYGAPIQVNAGTQNFTTVLKEKNVFQVYAEEAQTDSVKNELRAIADTIGVDILILGQTVLKDTNNVTAQAQTFDARTLTFGEIAEETILIKKPKFQTLIGKLKIGLNGGKSEISSKAVSTVPTKTTTAVVEAPKQTKETKSLKDTKVSKTKEMPTQDFLSDFNEKPAKKYEGDSSSKPFYKKWWFWGVVGVVVVGGAGAYLLTKDNAASSNIVTIPNPL